MTIALMQIQFERNNSRTQEQLKKCQHGWYQDQGTILEFSTWVVKHHPSYAAAAVAEIYVARKGQKK